MGTIALAYINGKLRDVTLRPPIAESILKALKVPETTIKKLLKDRGAERDQASQRGVAYSPRCCKGDGDGEMEGCPDMQIKGVTYDQVLSMLDGDRTINNFLNEALDGYKTLMVL